MIRITIKNKEIYHLKDSDATAILIESYIPMYYNFQSYHQNNQMKGHRTANIKQK